jgi:DNA-directed RNA polymerase sigma subunit (sigma70/sigma32)
VGDGSPVLRLLQAGTEGLLYAVEAFDPTSGETFGAHAGGWIEQEVQRVVVDQPQLGS